MTISSKNLKYLLFLTKPYSVSILEPIAENIISQNSGTVKWFNGGSAKGIEVPGEQLFDSDTVHDFNPDAVIVPGNIVPDYWPGIKVQIFHGLGEEKRGHYRINNLFDMYCTPGPLMTNKFIALKNRHKSFQVIETGWPKLDRLNPSVNISKRKSEFGFDPEKPVILYAPTFSPRYGSAKGLLNEIRGLQDQRFQWLVKFHSLMNKSIISGFALLENNSFKINRSDDILPLMEAADILLTDTSSVAYEYLLLDRPIITFRTTTRSDKGINLLEPVDLRGALERSLLDPDEYSWNRSVYRDMIHPYNDGQSAPRVLQAINTGLTKTAIDRKIRQKPSRAIQRTIERAVA